MNHDSLGVYTFSITQSKRIVIRSWLAVMVRWARFLCSVYRRLKADSLSRFLRDWVITHLSWSDSAVCTWPKFASSFAFSSLSLFVMACHIIPSYLSFWSCLSLPYSLVVSVSFFILAPRVLGAAPCRVVTPDTVGAVGVTDAAGLAGWALEVVE